MAVKAAQVGSGLARSLFRHGMVSCALSLASWPIMQAAAHSDPSALTDEGLRRQDELRRAQQRELRPRTDVLQAQPPRLGGDVSPVGHGLVGAVPGLHARFMALQFELSLAALILKPEGFKSEPTNVYANATYGF